MTLFRILHHIKTSLWFVPLLFMVAAAAISLVSVAADPDGAWVPESVTGDATAVTQILYLISFAMLTLTGLVLSLVVVVVQLAMGVFSPRIVRQILQDRPSQCAIGLFSGTFIHALLTLRGVDSGGAGTVPGLAVAIAIALALCCIGTLVWYINHIGQSLRVAALVGWVTKDTLKTLDRMYPPVPGTEPREPGTIAVADSGVIFMIDHERLVRHARRAGCSLELMWSVGDYVPAGAVLMRVRGRADGLRHAKVASCVATGPERTLNQDVAYGLRMLVDIAEKTLSSSKFADPTTVVQAIDRIHDIMRHLVRRPLHDGRYHDDDDVLRLEIPTML